MGDAPIAKQRHQLAREGSGAATYTWVSVEWLSQKQEKLLLKAISADD
jgi:hypothetical protein